MRKTLQHASIGLFISLLLSVSVYANERSYMIEILVFSQDSLTNELFEQTETHIAWPKKIINRTDLQEVSPDQMEMRDFYTKLNRSRFFRPIMHDAWVQTVQANQYGDAVKLKSYDGSLSGFFRMQRGHLVHMIMDLEYQPKSFAEPIIYRLNEKRRFKFNEIHYLDHPKFGVLARITPLSDG